MTNTLKATLKPRQSVFDKNYKDVVLDITDLPQGKINPAHFFAENYITTGMEQLYKAVIKRFEGSSQDGVFKLTQAMGGGKTHNMVAVGLMAEHPKYRQEVMGHIYKTSFTGTAKAITFSGRDRPDNGLWGHIAQQLGKSDFFKHLYESGDAPGQSDWIKLLQGPPILILLDELPDYFKYATTVQSGFGSLADKTARALTTLLNAIGKTELSNVALVLSDLHGSYEKGSSMIAEVLGDFEKETQRIAKNFTPVQQNSNEIYYILRKRLFENEASEKVIQTVAKAYNKALEKVVKMDLTNDSPQRLEAAILESYPFHPAMRDLYARFKENPGFMQTRGLIRLMRSVTARMYDKKEGFADKTSLIHPYDIDPNDSDTNTELGQINNKLINAISNDIASEGQAAAEKLSEDLGNDLPLKTAKLLYMSSLSLVQGATKGLRRNELFAYLAAPEADIASLNSKVLPDLRERSWYLHSDKNGSLLYKDIQNVSAKISTYRKTYNQEAIRKGIRSQLKSLFAPNIKDVYQEIYVLPAVDEIQEDKNKVALIIYQPYQSGAIHPDLMAKYESIRFKNRLLFLTGDHQSMDTVFELARSIRAAEDVKGEMLNDNVPTSDPQLQEVDSLLEGYEFRFYSAVQNVFTKLFYPSKRGLSNTNINLQFKKNEYNGEEQIRKTLEEKRKFTTEITAPAFLQQIEVKLFAKLKKRPWNDVIETAATDTSAQWFKPNTLEQIKAEQIQKDHWRQEGNWVQIGPFEKSPTEVLVNTVSIDEKTGKTRLKVKPVRGQVVHYDYGTTVSENSPIWDVHNPPLINDMQISFLCVDKEGKHKTGKPFLWENEIIIKHDYKPQGNAFQVALKATPQNVTIKYSTDGSNPLNHGGVYEAPFTAQPRTKVLAVAIKGDFQSKQKEFDLPKANDTTVSINKDAVLTYTGGISMETTAESYQLLGLLKRFQATLTTLEISVIKGEEWVALQTAPALSYSAEKAEIITKFIQDNLYAAGEISLSATIVTFPTGQAFLDFAKEASIAYKPQDIEQ